MKSNNRYFKPSIAMLLLLTGFVINAKAQLKVGSNPSSINSNSVLEIESTTKGLRLPRVALTATTNASPLSSFVNGMVVFDSVTINDVTPGIYYSDGTKWIKASTDTSFWTLSGTNLYNKNTGNVGIGDATPGSNLTVNGSFAGNYRIATATGSVAATDYYVAYNGASNGTLTLPAASGTLLLGRTYHFKNTGSTTLTIAANGSELIDNQSGAGVSSVTLPAGYYALFISKGTTGAVTTWETAIIGTSSTTVDVTNDAFVNNAASTRVELGTNADGVTTRTAGTQFVVQDNGYVGAGTSSPSTMLDVNGSARVRTVSTVTNGSTTYPLFVDGSGNVVKALGIPDLTNYVTAAIGNAGTANITITANAIYKGTVLIGNGCGGTGMAEIYISAYNNFATITGVTGFYNNSSSATSLTPSFTQNSASSISVTFPNYGGTSCGGDQGKFDFDLSINTSGTTLTLTARSSAGAANRTYKLILKAIQ